MTLKVEARSAARTVRIGPWPLSWEEYESVVYDGARVQADDEDARAARDMLERRLSDGETIYSVNTGFGADFERRIPAEAIPARELSTLRAHAILAGATATGSVVRGMTLLMARSCAHGAPAMRPALVERLTRMLNDHAEPVVPVQTTVSASDLIPAGHVALAALDGLTLAAKDSGLANNAALSAALAFDAVREALALLDAATRLAAMTLQALRGHSDPFDERLVALRPHPGALAIAAQMRALLAGSSLLGSSARPHDPFCLRCIPQVHGAVSDALTYARTAIEVELGAVTDNPVLVGDQREVRSGGNFHGEPIALPLDLCTIAMSELAQLSARRTAHLVGGRLEPSLPAGLHGHNDEVGLVMLSSAATALAGECAVRAHPASTFAGQVDAMEDHVSMAALASRNAHRTVTLARRVVAAELVCAAQALDLHGVQSASSATRQLHAAVRSVTPFLDHDQPVDLEPVVSLLARPREARRARPRPPEAEAAAAVEIVRRAYALLEDGEVDAFLELVGPDVIVEQTDAVPWGGRVRGTEALVRFFERLHDHVDSTATPEEYLSSGEFVVAIGRSRGTTRRTAAPFDIRIVHVWEIHEERVVAFRPFVDAPALSRALSGAEG